MEQSFFKFCMDFRGFTVYRYGDFLDLKTKHEISKFELYWTGHTYFDILNSTNFKLEPRKDYAAL